MLSAARNSRLEGSIAEAMRGEGDLGSDLQGVARGAAERTIVAAEAGGCDEGGDSGAALPEHESGTPSAERIRTQSTAVEMRYPSRMPVPSEWEGLKAAYDAFGKVRCMSCESGYGHDGWPSWPRDEFSGKYSEDEKRLGSLPIGHVYRWQACRRRAH